MKPLILEGGPENWPAQMAEQMEQSRIRARNWGLVCGFGYGFAAATFAFMILLFTS